MNSTSLALSLPVSPGSPQLILLATDFCAPAGHALACARRIAQLRGAQVRAVHVMDLTGSAAEDSPAYSVVHDSAQSRLREIRRELRLAGISESATLVTAGRPAQAIRQLTAEEKPALLILGINGSRSRKDSTLGSTARALLRSVPCPVLTVRPMGSRPVPAPACATASSLLVTDTAPASLRAGLAAWPPLTGAPQLRVVLPPDNDHRLEQEPEMDRRFATTKLLDLAGAALSLLRESADSPAGPIILAVRAGGYLDNFASGSFAHTLITRACRPVLTVRC